MITDATFVKAKVALEELDDGQMLNERWRAGTECAEKREGRRTSDPVSSRTTKTELIH